MTEVFMRLKRVLSLLLIVSVLFGLMTPMTASAVSGIMKGGTWNDTQQGYRFSIYDTALMRTVCCVDFLSEDAMERYDYDVAKNLRFYTAMGNKLEYLYMYEQGMDIHQIAEEGIVWYEAGVRDYKQIMYRSNGTADSEAFNNALYPIYSRSIGDGEFEWYVPQNMRLILSQTVDMTYTEYVLNKMGFSIVGDPEYEYLSSEYVLVVEPLFWFYNHTTDRIVNNTHYGTEGFFLYGTATEWALFDQKYHDEGEIFYNKSNSGKVYSGSIHATMGLLTAQAGPASALIEKGREIVLGDNTVLRIKESDSDISDLERKKDAHRDTSDNWHVEMNTLILESYGAEMLTPLELAELNIDIVGTNTLFRTGTKAMLSFYAISSGEIAYLPEYIDLVNDPAAYGLKLVLETAPGSDLKLEPVELTSYGMPALKYGVSTYIFGEFDVPIREGSWTFTLTAYDGSGNRLSYSSGNGTPPRNEKDSFEFTVRFMDVPTEYPEDALALDVRQNDLVIEPFEPQDIAYTSTGVPVTYTEWHYYEAVPFENITNGEQTVMAYLKNETAEASMEGLYLPKVHNNVPYTKQKGEYCIGSGYGIGVELDSADAVQTGADNYQAGIVLFPEYNYCDYACELEMVGGGLVMEMNPYSMYFNEVLHSDYSRVHFTPLWYPDGEYNIIVFLYEYWTPAGMLWDYAEYTVHISGSVYDDWYITRN